MSSSDLHEFVMRWPHADANEVLGTGTFDQWSSSVRLERTPTGFEGPVRIPYGEKIQYKFIVDGMWITDEAAPSEADGGFVNNVYTAPAKPAPAAEPSGAAEPKSAARPSDVPAVEPASEPVAETTSGPAPGPAAESVSVVEPAPESTAELASEPATNESVVSAVKDFAEQTPNAHDAATPAAGEEPKTLFDDVKDTTAPVTDAASEFAEQLNGGIDAPTPKAIEPTKTMFDYVKGAVASFVPSISPRSTSPPAPASPSPMPAPEPIMEVEDAPNVPVGIVTVVSAEESATITAEPAVVLGTAVVAAGEDVPPVGSTPASAPKVVEAALPAVEVAPILIEKVEAPKDESAPALAPPVLAAEPVSSSKEEPKETSPTAAPVDSDVTAGGLVSSSNSNWAAMMAAAMPKTTPVTDAAPVAAIPTAAAVTSAQETKPEDTVSEGNTTAPEVLAAPPTESTNGEVAPVEEHKSVVSSKPAEELKPSESKAIVATALATAPATPKKETPPAPMIPGSNGKPTTSRSGTLRGLKFPGYRRQSSGDVTPEKSRSASESVKDSSRKKRLSMFGKVKEAFHKDKMSEKP